MDSGFSAEAQVGMNAAAGRYEAEAEYKKEIARLTEELAEARKKPEPTQLQTEHLFEKMQNEIDLLKAENAIYALSANAQQNVIRRLTADLKAKDDKAKDEEIAKLRKAVLEALGDAKALWAGVGNHPASRYAKDIAYYEQVLKGEVTNG